MRRSIIAVLAVSHAGCSEPEVLAGAAGPPEVLQVLVRERATVTDDAGRTHVELAARLAFGDHADIDLEADDRVVDAAVARGGQRIRVVLDELLRGNQLEEVACADGSWSRVPVGADLDDVARCAGADLGRCEGICIGPAGPVGILDQNQDGAFDDTRLIAGAVVLSCDGVAVDLDLERSYYQPSGGQRLSTGPVGTDALGPAVVVVPAAGLRPGARCSVGFAPDVVDKQGQRPCAPTAAGCRPGDTAAIGFTVEPFLLAGSTPADGADAVALTDPDAADATVILTANAALEPASLPGAVRIRAGDRDLDDLDVALAADDPATIVIPVRGGFAAATTYAVTVVGGAGGVHDVFAGALAGDATFTFTTAGEP